MTCIAPSAVACPPNGLSRLRVRTNGLSECMGGIYRDDVNVIMDVIMYVFAGATTVDGIEINTRKPLLPRDSSTRVLW